MPTTAPALADTGATTLSRDLPRPRTTDGLLGRPAFRRLLLDASLLAAACIAVNVLVLRGPTWWPVAWALIAFGVVRQARRMRRRSARGEPHVAEAARLRHAVEELAAAASPAERDLLGDVQRPVALLEERVERLVEQARQVDAALALHDESALKEELTRCRSRVAAGQEDEARDAAASREDVAALRTVERQLETLSRVRRRRDRIEARLGSCVNLMRSLHLDLVELRSSDLSGQSGTLRRLGEQVREVSRNVDALAAVMDEDEHDAVHGAQGVAARSGEAAQPVDSGASDETDETDEADGVTAPSAPPTRSGDDRPAVRSRRRTRG